MKKAKRLLTFLLTAFMIFALLPRPALAAAVTRLEAENAITSGSAKVATGQAGASDGSVVGYFNSDTAASVTFADLQEAAGVVIGYSSVYTGTISVYVNNTHIRDAAVTSTGGWTGAEQFKTIALDIGIKSGDDLKLQCDPGDVALNVDYLDYSPFTPIPADGAITADGTYKLSAYGGDKAITIMAGRTVTLTGGGTTFTKSGINCGTGVNLTLNNVTINHNSCALSFTGAGNTLTLVGASSLQSGYEQPGVKVEGATELTIRGNGSLSAYGGKYSAGIGSLGSGGVITIDGGTVTATGGEYGAGIGGGSLGSGGVITIDGGTVTATGGENGAGIGGGYRGSGGKITIKKGKVTANDGSFAAGIGGGGSGGGGTITITGGEVTATSGSNSGGAGIGGGGGSVGGNGGTITISGGKVTATGGGYGGAGIGGGRGRGGGTITISGGTVKATSIAQGSGIGGGGGGATAVAGDGNIIRISGGSVNAIAGSGIDKIGGGGGAGATPSDALKNGDGVEVYLTAIRLVGGDTGNTAIASLVPGLDGYDLKDVFSDSSGKLYLYLPQGTQITEVNAAGILFAGNAVTASPPTEHIFECDLSPDERITNDLNHLVWEAIKGSNSEQADVKVALNLPKAGENGTTIAWSASPAGIINTDTGTITRPLDSAQGVSLSATVSYAGGTAKTKTFNLTVPKHTGRFEAEDAVIVSGSIFSGAEAAGASEGKQVGNLSVKGISSVEWSSLPASSSVEIRYASQNNGTISIYKNGTHVTDASFTASGGWYGEGRFASLWLSLEIAAGDSITVRYDDGDAVLNLDYMECYISSFENASISPASGTFDKTHPADVTTTIQWNDAAAVKDVKAGTASIGAANYNVSGNTLTVNKGYLATLPMGEKVLTVEFQRGASATLAVNITKSWGTTIAADGTYNLSDYGSNSTTKINTGLTVTLEGAAATYTNVTFYCEAGVKLTINNVNIDNSACHQVYALSFTGEGSTLTLVGTNTLKGGAREPGLKVEGTTQLTIRGSGSLTSTGGEFSAGIGGAINCAGGILTIDGGTVTAIGGSSASGIGGGHNCGGGTTTINGGTVTASGGQYGAGIGGGNTGAGGNTIINGGTVTAAGGLGSAGIGGGYNAVGGSTVTINGGTVKATGGSLGAGIGGGGSNVVGNVPGTGTVTISGGTIDAKGGGSGAGIGGGGANGTSAGGEGVVTITGGTITAIGGGAGIGGGNTLGSAFYSGGAGVVTITGGSVNAASTGGAANIGGGKGSSGSTLKNSTGADVYLTSIQLSDSGANNAAVSWLTTDLADYEYGLNDVSSDSLGKLYLYLPQGTVTTKVGISNGNTFSGNATTTATSATFEFLLSVLTPDVRIEADLALLDWNAIKGGNSAENDVKTALNLPKTGANSTDISWSASPAGIINADTGAVTRQLADKTVALTATVSYTGAAAKTKTFNLTVPATTGKFEAEDAVTNARIYGDVQAVGASGGKQVGSISTVGRYVQWNNLPASPMLEIRYASPNDGTISIYKNGAHIQDVTFASTGDWYGEGCFGSLWLPLEIASGNSLKVQYDTGDAILNLDYLACYASLIKGAVISPASGTFDLNPAHQVDVATTVQWNDATSVTDVKLSGTTIGAENYSVNENTLSIKKEYLAAKSIGPLALTIIFDKGASVTLTITVTDTTPKPTVSASLSPAEAVFDLDDPGDVATAITWNDAKTVTGVVYGSDSLVESTDFTVDEATLTITEEFLSGLSLSDGDTVELVISFDKGESATLTVEAQQDYVPGTDATLSGLTVGGSTVSGFAADTYSYNVELPHGTLPESVAATVGATVNDPKAAVSITQAVELPGSATVVVTAEDGETKLTYTVNFTLGEAPAGTYSVTYDANGGSGGAPAESDKAAGATFAAADNTFTPPSGKKFKYWYTNPLGTGGAAYAKDTPDATVTMPAHDLILYAIWEDESTEVKRCYLEVKTLAGGTVKLNDDPTPLLAVYSEQYRMGTSIRLEAAASSGYTFVYWLNVENSSIISTSPVYEIIMGSGINVTAVFSKVPAAEDTWYTVTFKDKSGKILQSTNVAKNESVTPPSAPPLFGYSFSHWSHPSGNVTSNMVITAVYVREAGTYTVAVTDGTLSTGGTEGSYKFDMPVRVVAGVAPDGQKFSHWEQDGKKVSTKPEFTFFAPMKNTSFAAVFVDNGTVLDNKPFITLSNDVMVNGTNGTIMFTAIKDLPVGYTLVESGVLLLISTTPVTELTVDTPNVILGKILDTSTGQFYIMKSNVGAGGTWYGRAYLICKDSEGNTLTVYSDNIENGTR
ncbi:X2-like carbohydrate binding domain-containing protein [Desulfoscipio gibsoniae]